ncbi:hypothetical protein GCM10023205_53290 [Yinghuangia aomiensis]|uniref:Transposase DDE domain-containing protein n=1 Tax=Yinghuangia aomiensis TaxID=676205 RepID=A0ABP9HUD5_9ACTN
MSWLTGYRRLTIRYERRSDLALAFTTLAAALIGFKRIRGHTTSRSKVPSEMANSAVRITGARSGHVSRLRWRWICGAVCLRCQHATLTMARHLSGQDTSRPQLAASSHTCRRIPRIV